MDIMKRISALALSLVLMGGIAEAQSTNHVYSQCEELDCGEYQWPLVQVPCPEVQIKQKHDHTSLPQYRINGWDTVVTCTQRQLILSVTPYLPVEKFYGYYCVEQIPYNPPDTSFCLGTRMPIGTDDVFAGTHTTIPYPFYFFGIRKEQFRIGANGLVTFCSPTDFGSGDYCPFAFRGQDNKLPWNGTTDHDTPSGATYFNRMHDAIYGVYEDTDPAYFVGSETNRVDGIFYGIQDQYPCRKIICSWKEAPDYSSHSNKGTYQIVCYEGSNIIEVHVKKRRCCPTTSDALIGIQNATGQPQVKPTDPTATNFFVQSGAPAAFYPSAYNGFTNNLDTIAFRFTPLGTTDVSENWFRIFENGDTVNLPSNYNNPSAMNDTNGYYVPMNPYNITCPSLSLAYVSPSVESKYAYHLRFRNANGDYYDLYDTITIGMDTVRDLTIREALPDGDTKVLDICQGDTASMVFEISKTTDTARLEWNIFRISRGDTIELPTATMNVSNITTDGDVRRMPFSINSNTLPTEGQLDNKIDSLYIICVIDFVSGCNNNAKMLVRVFPNFDTTTTAFICRGERYEWNNQTYTESTNPNTTFLNLRSQPGCDSIARLDLTVLDVSYTIDHIEDCKPVTWANGKTYTQSNTETALSDTVRLANIYGCDSIVQLELIINPLTAKIQSSIDAFTLDKLDVELTDISIGGNSRVWKLPSAADQTGVRAYYSIPAELDGAEIVLVEHSQYGCVDTAKLYLPLNKEHFWIPNVFTPDDPAGNNTFGSVSTKTLQQEMIIYNRRGEMVFRCEGVDCAWDGRDMDGNPCVQGAYAYIIRYTNEFNPKKTIIRKGSVTLLR